MIEIDKGIPLPEVKRAEGRTGISQVVRNLEIGDSFFIHVTDKRLQNSRRSSVTNAAFRYGIKIAARANQDGVRFWRVA